MTIRLRVTISVVVLALVTLPALLAGWISPRTYDQQFREAVNTPPSAQFLLGTDALGRDRFVRLLHASRVSLLIAPAAALVAVFTAALVGGIAGWLGGFCHKVVSRATEVALSLPWLLLLLAVRAALPLDTSPASSVAITFLVLGLLGWIGPAQVVAAGVAQMVSSDFVFAARARGLRAGRIFWGHLLPNLRPVLAAQLWTTIPAFILAEANLSMLGLGVAEPLPSLGNMLREVESAVAGWGNPLAHYWVFAPAAVLLLVMCCLQGLFPTEVSQ
jgi:ABC-type dipeptide/oligopeptide/nickel transport system permease subunit